MDLRYSDLHRDRYRHSTVNLNPSFVYVKIFSHRHSRLRALPNTLRLGRLPNCNIDRSVVLRLSLLLSETPISYRVHFVRGVTRPRHFMATLQWCRLASVVDSATSIHIYSATVVADECHSNSTSQSSLHLDMTSPTDLVYNVPAPNIPYFTPAQVPPAGSALVPQPSGKSIPTLFQPIKIRGVEFPNRIWVRFGALLFVRRCVLILIGATAVTTLPVLRAEWFPDALAYGTQYVP